MSVSRKEEIQRATQQASVSSIVGIISFVAACVIILTVPAWTVAFYRLMILAAICFEFSAFKRVKTNILVSELQTA